MKEKMSKRKTKIETCSYQGSMGFFMVKQKDLSTGTENIFEAIRWTMGLASQSKSVLSAE